MLSNVTKYAAACLALALLAMGSEVSAAPLFSDSFESGIGMQYTVDGSQIAVTTEASRTGTQGVKMWGGDSRLKYESSSGFQGTFSIWQYFPDSSGGDAGTGVSVINADGWNYSIEGG